MFRRLNVILSKGDGVLNVMKTFRRPDYKTNIIILNIILNIIGR